MSGRKYVRMEYTVIVGEHAPGEELRNPTDTNTDVPAIPCDPTPITTAVDQLHTAVDLPSFWMSILSAVCWVVRITSRRERSVPAVKRRLTNGPHVIHSDLC